MPHPAAVGTHPPSSPTSTSSASSTSSRSSRRALANANSGRQRHPGAHRDTNKSQPQIISTKNNIICGQQPQHSSQSKSTVTQNQRQQQVKQNTTNNSPPSTERTGPEGEADEEEPSEIDSFLLDDNEIESEEENFTRTSNSSPIPNIDQLSPDKEYLGEDNEEDEEDSDDLDADLRAVNSIASSTSHRRFLLTENLLSSSERISPTEEFRVAGDGKEPDEKSNRATHFCSNSSSSSVGIDSATETSKISVSREKISKGVKTTLIGSVSSEITTRSKLGASSKVVGLNNSLSTAPSSLPTDIHPVDPETQARLEALLEAAGIGKLTGETKQLTDPEVLKRLTSSVSCALDEAAAALTRMRTDPPGDGRSLVEACNEGDISKVRKLLDEGRVSVHDTTEEGESLLSLACSAGYFELAQVLLAMRANVEDRGMKGDCTPLMEAASAGHTEIVKLLLSHNAEVNAQSSSGNTPLMYACAGGHEDVVQMLLEAHANVEDHNENGHTPLMEAASAGHVGVAKILLKNGAGINTHSNEFKESALTLACYKGHLEMVRFLLDAGADQEHKTDEMHTALMEASMDGHVEVARLLLDSGAQVNMPADSFESPLTLAACGGHVELAMLLLERGANIEEVNDEGYTPLMEASREGHEEMVALLLSQGADINAQTEETQETALTLACCGGFLEVADFLIKAGANIELGASTPLMESAQEGHIELTKYLLQNGADVNAQSGTGDTALTYACENGHTDVSDLLLKYNAVLEHESEGGRTPLMKAARAGHLCTVQFLISKGADVNRTTTNNDHTPLSLACAGGHISIVELLLQHGADPYHKLKDNSTMLIEAAKGGHTNVVSILIDYPNSLVMTNEAAMAFSDPTANGGPPQASLGSIQQHTSVAHQQTPHHVNAAAVHPGQVSIGQGGQMSQEQMALAMQHEQHSAQVVGGVPVATAHLQQAGKNINIVPTGQLTGSHPVVSGPAPPPPPPPPSNQQNKSVLRKSQRTSATVSGATNQSLNNQQKDGNKDPNKKGNTSSLASSAARSILNSAGMAGVGMPPSPGGQNIGIEASGFDYIEGSGFVMEGLEDKGLDAKSYIQSVLRGRHEGGATREEQIIQKEQILAELQRVEKELKEKGPAAAASNVSAVGPLGGGNNVGQQFTNTSGHKAGMSSGGNTSISLNIPAATEILQNMANLTLQDQHHRGADHHPCSSTVTSSTQTVQVTNQNCPPTSHPGISSSNVVGQDQPGLNISGSASSLGTTSGNTGKRSSSNNNNANVANLLPNERPKVKASRKIPGKESLSPSSKDNNIMVTTSANTSPGGSASVTVGSTQPQQTGQTSMTNIVGTVAPIPDGSQQQAKKSDSQLQAARHQHSQQLAQLQQLQQLNQQLQEQVLYQRQQKQQNQATLAALQQNAIANQQQLAALQQNVAQLQQLEQHILQQQQQATSHAGADLSSVPSSSGGTQSSSSSGTNVSSSASSIASTIASVNTPSNNSSAANQQHQQLQGKIQQIVQQKQQLQAQIKQFQQQVEQQLAYTQNATPGSAMGQLAREGVPTIVPNETLSQNQGTAARASNKRSKDNAASSSKDNNSSNQASKMDSSGRQTGGGKNNRNKNQAGGNNLQLSGESQPASSVANAAYELVQASQALQAVQALQQQHLDTSSASPSNQGSTSPGSGDVEPLTQDPALLTSLDPVHLAAAVQNCPLPLDANCQAILNGYKEGMQAGQALATTLQAAVNSGSMQIQYPIQVPAGTQGGSSDYNSGTGQPCQIGSQQITGGTSNQMTATSIGLDQLLLQGPQFPFGPASVDSNGQINFTSAADLPGSSYIHHQGVGGSGNNPDTSALFLPAGAQLSVPPGEHGQLVLQSGGQMISQHGQLQPDLPGVVQCPGGTIECLDSNAIAATNLPSTGTPGKKTKHGGIKSSKTIKHQQVANPQEIQDALDKQGGQSGDLFSAAAAAAAAAAATAGIPVQEFIAGQGQPGVIPNNCSGAATIEAQQYAQGYATAPCGPDGIPLPGAPGVPGMDGIDANNMDGLAAVSVDLDSATESNHDTALTLACAGGHEDLVTLLLGRGSDIEHRDKKGFTPLILAATAGHEKVVEILLEHNADIEAQSERTKDTPLSLACSGGRYEVVEVLLKKHANKEHRNVSDYTPLSLAASGGYVNIIKLLLAHGAEINSRTGSKLGISPLMLAAMNGHTASVKLLLDMGSDINAQIETNRNTALTLACFQGRHEVVSLLLDRKANVEHRAKTGLTPLMEAASGGYVDVGRVLLDKNADVNAPPVPSSRDTALTIAADKGHYRFVELLLSRGAQVDVRNKKGNSSLWLAANGGHIDVVQLLYSAGADIDSQDNRKVSCLMAAFRKGHSKVVKWMVKHVAQYPSDQELTRYIATINDKDLLKKCNTCMDIIRVAKDRQAAEAAKNANSLLEELDREKNIEESKKAAAARKREKKKRKKMEKKGGKDDGSSYDAKGMGDDDDECDLDGKDDNDVLTGTEDEKEKTPEILADATMEVETHSGRGNAKNMMNHNNNEGDSGIDANSQGSSASREDKMDQGQTLPNNKEISNKDSKDQSTKKGKNKNKKGKTIKESPSSSNRERERNEKNAASSASTSEHEPTPPPLSNTSTVQQLKISSNTSSNIIGNNKNEHTNSNQSNTFGKQSTGSSANITNKFGKASTNDQDHNENKENKKQQEQLSYDETRVPQTPDQQVIINTFDPSCIQGGTGQTIKKPGRGRRNVSNASGSQVEPHDVGYPRSGGSTGNKHLLGAPNNIINSNSPRKNGSSRGGGNSGPNAGNRNNSGMVEDAGWKEVVRKSRKVVVAASAISRVIGRGGNNINAIRELSGAHIEVEKQGKGGAVGSDRTILIKGSADATRQASTWINSVIANPDKDLSEIIGKPYRQLQAQQQSSVGSFIPPIQQTVIVTNSGAAGMSSSSVSATTFTSNKSVSAGQIPSSFGQAVFSNSSSAGGFANLMASKPNFTGGSTVNTKLTGSLSTATSLMTTSVAGPVTGSKASVKDANIKDKEKKSNKPGSGIPAFTSGLVSGNKGGNTSSNDKANKVGSFAAVAGGVEIASSSANTTATPSFGMISAGGPHPGTLSNQQQKARVGGKSGAPPGISTMDSRGNKTNVSQFSGNTTVQSGQYSMTRTPGLNTNTSSSSSQFNAPPTSNNPDMILTQSGDKDGFGQYAKGNNQKQQGSGSSQGGRPSNPSLDNKDYSPFKTLGVVSWGAPGLSAMDASKEDKLGTANWAPHLPNMGSSSRISNPGQNNLQPPPSIPLPPSATGGGNSDSLSNVEVEMAKASNQDLASRAPGYRANVNASPSWGVLSNNSANGNKSGATGGATAADALIYQQQQERCNSAPGTPISPIGPSPIGPPTSTKSGASSTVSPGSEAGDGNIHSFNNRGGIGPIGPNSGFGSVRSITPDDMDYRRRAGLPTLDGKESLLPSMNTAPPIARQANNSSSLTNKPSMMDPMSDLSILNAAAQMAASGGTFNDFLAQQSQKGFGLSNQSFTDLMNNGSANSLINQASANSSSRVVGPSAPPPPLPQSITSGLYNDPATKLNPNAPDFLRLQAPPGATNFVRAPGPSGQMNSGLGRNMTSMASSTMPNKYVLGNNQYGGQVTMASRMNFGQGNSGVSSGMGNGPNQLSSNAVSSNQLVSNLSGLSNFSNILNNQSINALLNQANLTDLSGIGNGGNSFDTMSANLVGGKSIREINEMLSGNNPSNDQSTQGFSGNGSSLFMNNPLLNSQHGGNTSNLEEQPKSKAIGSERHRTAGPTPGIQPGMAPPQPPSNQGPMPPNMMNKNPALNRLQAGGLRTQAPSNPWDGPGYYDGNSDQSSGRQNQSGQNMQQFPFPSSLQGHTLESLLKSTATLPGVDNFADQAGVATSGNFMAGLGNGGSSGAPPSPLSGLGSPANVTPNKNDFTGGFGGPAGDSGINFPGSQQAPIGSAGKNMSMGYSMESVGNRPNDSAVNSVRRNMNTMWGNPSGVSTKKWGDEM